MHATPGELCVTPRTQCNYVVGKRTPRYVPWLYTEHNDNARIKNGIIK